MGRLRKTTTPEVGKLWTLHTRQSLIPLYAKPVTAKQYSYLGNYRDFQYIQQTDGRALYLVIDCTQTVVDSKELADWAKQNKASQYSNNFSPLHNAMEGDITLINVQIVGNYGLNGYIFIIKEKHRSLANGTNHWFESVQIPTAI